MPYMYAHASRNRVSVERGSRLLPSDLLLPSRACRLDAVSSLSKVVPSRSAAPALRLALRLALHLGLHLDLHPRGRGPEDGHSQHRAEQDRHRLARRVGYGGQCRGCAGDVQGMCRGCAGDVQGQAGGCMMGNA